MALGDMFLRVETQRQGLIKGEAHDAKHTDEIDVVSWSWGMRAPTAISGMATGKSTLNELDVVKRVDSASTGLMAGMRNNEVIKKAVLTVRKSGDKPLEYFRITLQNARISSLEVQTNGLELTERLSFAFQKIHVDYTPQGKDGAARGAMSFDADTTPDA